MNKIKAVPMVGDVNAMRAKRRKLVGSVLLVAAVTLAIYALLRLMGVVHEKILVAVVSLVAITPLAITAAFVAFIVVAVAADKLKISKAAAVGLLIGQVGVIILGIWILDALVFA